MAAAPTFQDKIQRGVELLESGNLRAARAALQELLNQEPSHPRIFVANQLLGRISLYERNYDSAFRYFDSAVQQAPQFTPALVGRARAALFLDRIENAAADLRKATAARDKAPEAELLLAEVSLLQNQPDDAASILNTIIADRAEGYADTARLLLPATTNAEAHRQKIIQALEHNLGKPEAYRALAYYYRANNETTRASKLFETAFHIDDQNPIAWLLSGKPRLNSELTQIESQQILAGAESNLAQGNYESAAEALDQLVKKRPMHIPAEILRLTIEEKQNNVWAAFNAYGKVMETLPELPHFPIRLGKLANSAGAFTVAECAFRRALTLQREDASLHYLLATALAGQGKLDAAIQSCNQAIAGGFRTAPVYVALGNLYYQKMQISDSISALSRAVQIDPKAAETIASFALSALTTEDYVKLRKLLEQHIVANPDSVNTLYGLAVMNLSEGRLEEAAAQLTRLQSLTPASPQVHYNLALLYGRQGNQAKATESMKRFQELKKSEQEEWQRQNDAFRKRILAKEALQAGDASRAITLLISLEQNKLAIFDDYLQLGRAHLHARNPTQADVYFEKALKLKPFDQDALQAASIRSVTYVDRLQLLKRLCEM